MFESAMLAREIDEDRGRHRGAVTTHVPNVGRHNDCGCGVNCGQLLIVADRIPGNVLWGLQRGVSLNNEWAHLG